MSDDVTIRFPDISTVEVHKRLANAKYYVLLAVDANNDMDIITNLAHKEDLAVVLAAAQEEVDERISNSATQ